MCLIHLIVQQLLGLHLPTFLVGCWVMSGFPWRSDSQAGAVCCECAPFHGSCRILLVAVHIERSPFTAVNITYVRIQARERSGEKS